MRLHKEGYVYVAITTAILAATAAWVYYAPSIGSWALLAVGGTLWSAVLNFFRHPRRRIKGGIDEVLSPCDGKVVVIEKVYEPNYFKDERRQVSIFMSPLDVHVNRVPISGRVAMFKYFPGKYLVAWHPKSSTENEQTFIVVENERVAVGFKQIAGAVARRIKCYVKEGDAVAQGQEFGFIKFGSRMDVFLPLDATVEVKLGQKTVGGITVVGRLK